MKSIHPARVRVYCEALDDSQAIDRSILHLRFGLGGEPVQTRAEIGKRVGLTGEEVKVRLATLYRRIRKAAREQGTE